MVAYSESNLRSTVIGVPTVRPVAVSTTATLVRHWLVNDARRLGDHERARTILAVLHRIHRTADPQRKKVLYFGAGGEVDGGQKVVVSPILARSLW